MIWSFPNDCMHLLDLGAAKAMLRRILNNEAKYVRETFTIVDAKKLSKTNISLIEFVPIEFNRKPRSLQHLGHWKAVDFRFFLLYSGFILLRHENIHDDLYNHFMCLSFAYRLVSTRGIENDYEKLEYAQLFFNFFVSEYRNVYGLLSVTYNIHNILHIVDAVKLYGSVDNFTNYKFENYLNEIKSHIRKRSHVLQQLHNRLQELNAINYLMENSDGRGAIQPFPGNTRSYHGFKFDEFTIKDNKADSCCKIKTKSEEFPFLVKRVQEHNGIMHVLGQRYINLESFSDVIANSAEIVGILKGKELNPERELFPVSAVSAKYVKLPLNSEEFIFLPMLHHL